MTVRVLLVDDQSLFREGLATLLSIYDEIDVVGEAENGAVAIEQCGVLRPDVVLMDLNMPVLDGVAATRGILASFPRIRIIVLTTFGDEAYLFEALRAGASGYLLKDVPSAKLAEAIQTVARGESFLQPSLTVKLLAEYNRLADEDAPGTNKAPTAPPPVNGLVEALSRRELEILREVADGGSNKEIADRLCIAEGTVKNHISNILGKLDVNSRTAAVHAARKHGLIDP